MKCLERHGMKIRPLGNGVLVGTKLGGRLTRDAAGDHRCAVNRSYRTLWDGSFFYTFSRHFMPRYHQLVPPGHQSLITNHVSPLTASSPPLVALTPPAARAKIATFPGTYY
jgi:hypothetical protein